MKSGLFLAVLLALAGCVTTKPMSPEIKEEVEKPLICNGKDQCGLYWQRATFYVNRNSAFKIQTVNENLIQTFSPTGGSPLVGFNVSKEPQNDGSVRIWVLISCDNMFGCVPDVPIEMAKFKKYVRTGM